MNGFSRAQLQYNKHIDIPVDIPSMRLPTLEGVMVIYHISLTKSSIIQPAVKVCMCVSWHAEYIYQVQIRNR